MVGGLLASIETVPDFVSRIARMGRHIKRLTDEDMAGTQLILFNRSVSHYGSYSVNHGMLCATLVCAMAGGFGLDEAQAQTLIGASLTMNVAMTQLQDVLAAQRTAPNAHQRADIDAHAARGADMLQRAGIVDADWLALVAQHHTPVVLPGPVKQWPLRERMLHMLQVVDRYTAGLSPRKSRPGRSARDSVQGVLQGHADTKHDDVGLALLGMLGISPPGTYVKLANGETAMVLKRGIKPNMPIVAAVLNKSDELIAEPRVRDTSRIGFEVTTALSASNVRVHPNLELMLKLMPRGSGIVA
ncbi:MAG: hypothetical protein Fur007_22290 [Rhodoferax sp.]